MRKEEKEKNNKCWLVKKNFFNKNMNLKDKEVNMIRRLDKDKLRKNRIWKGNNSMNLQENNGIKIKWSEKELKKELGKLRWMLIAMFFLNMRNQKLK